MLTPTPAWTEAFDRGGVKPIYLLEIDVGGGTTFDFVTGAKPIRDVSGRFGMTTLDNVDPASPQMDVWDRDINVGGSDATFADDGEIRRISDTVRLKNKQATLTLGAEGMDFADYLPVAVFTVVDVRPTGDTIVFDIADIYEFSADQEKAFGEFIQIHPLRGIVLLGEAIGLPSAFTGSSTLDETTYSGGTNPISHWNLSRWANETSAQPDRNTEITEATSGRGLIAELRELLVGTVYPREAGDIEFAQLDLSAAAVDEWDSNNMLADPEQVATYEDIVNQVHVSGSFQDRRFIVQYEAGDGNSKANFAFPGESEKIYQEKFESKWLNAWTLLSNSSSKPGPAATFIDIDRPTLHGWTGARLVDASWNPLSAPLFDHTDQRASDQLSASRLAYFKISGYGISGGVTDTYTEIITVDGMTFSDGGTFPFNNYLRNDGVEYWGVGRYTIAARGVLGTTQIDWSTGFNFVTITDITIPVFMVQQRLARHSNGVPKFRCSLPINRAKLQIGDVVNMNYDLYLNFNKDGVTTAVFWEILKKELFPFDDPPRCDFLIGWLRDDVAPAVAEEPGDIDVPQAVPPPAEKFVIVTNGDDVIVTGGAKVTVT